MKVRTDFVTNSSSSCYVIKLCITNTDNESLEYKGWIDESSDGYMGDEGTYDPRIMAEADSLDTLKQMLSAFGTLSENDYEIMSGNGERLDSWNPKDIPGCPEDEDEFEDWYDEILWSEGTKEYVFNGFLSKLDERIKSIENIQSISVECEGKNDSDTFIKEKYEYDLKKKAYTTEHEAQDEGDDVTEDMLHKYYTIDCGDDVLKFQLNLK